MFEYASNGILCLLNGILCLLFPDIKTPGLDVDDAKIKKDGVTKGTCKPTNQTKKDNVEVPRQLNTQNNHIYVQ